MQDRVCTVFSLGRVDYAQAWEMQRALAQLRAEGAITDILLLLEHPHVYTIGRRGVEADILLSREELERLGVQVHQVDRGGEVTYHGPGQLVGYPILDLRGRGGPLRYVRALEAALIETLQDFGISAGRIEGQTGVWVWEGAGGEEDRKIAAIGLRISRGVSTHGFALNVNTEIRYFDNIVPCGILDREVTSMARELGKEVDIMEVEHLVAEALGSHLGFSMRFSPKEALEELLRGSTAVIAEP